MNWTSSLLTFSGLSSLWTLCLLGISRWLVKDVYSVCHPVVPVLAYLFSVAAFSHALSTDLPYLYTYLFFFSALIVTIFTDATTLLISRYVTLYAMPLGWLASNYGLLPITPLESIGGSLAGLLILAAVRYIAQKCLGKDGLGQGDVDLLCFIGAFTGPSGCWITLMVASILGSFVGCVYYGITKEKQDILLPFGLFLGMGAILYVLFQKQLTTLFLPI